MSKDKKKWFIAYTLWRKKKNLYSLKCMIRFGFTGGNYLWRIWRIFKHTWIDGRYEKLYEECLYSKYYIS
jgi:hypothetical protein